jgi:hypothetical protein
LGQETKEEEMVRASDIDKRIKENSEGIRIK